MTSEKAENEASNTKTARTISRRACDACRLRKIKCEPLEEAASPPPGSSTSTADSSRKRSRGPETKPCKACAAVPLECTHSMPVKRRGPPNRLAQQAKALAAQHQSSPLTPDSGDAAKASVGHWSDRLSSHSGSSGHGTYPLHQNPDFEPGLYRLSDNGTHRSQGLGEPRSVPTPVAAAQFSLLRLPTVLDGVFNIQLICSKNLFDVMMEDYINILHPINPLVHVPTFRSDLRRQRYDYDFKFWALTISVCAYVVGALPRKFHEYHIYDPTFRFKSRLEMVDYCLKLLELGKPSNYMERPNQETWAVSLFASISALHVNLQNRSWAMIRECYLLSQHLGAHRISSYRGLDCVEAQLRKKSYWVTLYAFVHSRVLDERWPNVSDRMYWEHTDGEQVMPLEVDDEYITRTEVLPQPPFKTSLVVSFNAVTRIFCCLLPAIRDRSLPTVRSTARNEETADAIGLCDCGRGVRPATPREVILAMLDKIRYVIDDLPPEFGPWHSNAQGGPEIRDEITFGNYESMRANIHATHLWAQSILTERLIDCNHRVPQDEEDSRLVWSLREDLCRQLLQVLYNIRQSNLEPNGCILTMKIREVASTLLECPFEEQSHVARRARSYISKFVDLLARLDSNPEPAMELSLWNNLDSQPRTFPTHFVT